MTDKPTTIDEYLAAVDPQFRAELQRIRDIVTRLVPEAEETSSYRMLTLTYRGSALVFFTASKKHMSFYPSSCAIEERRDRLDGYDMTAHAIRFTLDNPLPSDLIEDLVRVHVRVIDADRR